MREVYLAYFDYLGFKEFIEKNEDDEIIRRMDHIFRDIEMSLSEDKYRPPSNGLIVSDLSESIIYCLNISDTVMFWTNDCSFESLKSLIKVAYGFNWREIGFNFPLRGAVVKGMIKEVTGKQINALGASYSLQCLYGKGIIKAHVKAEYQDWAGTVIDESVIVDLFAYSSGIDFLEEYAVKYKVPYKTDYLDSEEYVFRIVKKVGNPTTLENLKEDVNRIFRLDNKSVNHPSVQKKISNTIAFIHFLYSIDK